MESKRGNRQAPGAVRRTGHGGTASLGSSFQSLRPQTAGSSNLGPSKIHLRSYQTEDYLKKTCQVEEQIYTLENRREDDLLFSHTRSRSTSLLGYDLAQMIIEYLSILAMLLSSSLRWTWPAGWINAVGWTFLFNLDIFEFAKVYTPNVYTSVQAGYTKSASVPVPFWAQILLWGILTLILSVSFIGIFLYLWRRKSPRYYIQMSRLRRVYLLTTQLLALPFGVSLGKIFHCTSTSLMDVDNNLICWGGAHWAYLIIAIIAALAFYFLIPAYMIYRTDRQIVSLTDGKHEAYLRLKEHEYKRGLDALWYISEFYLFSSFRRAGIFYRPVMHLLKLTLVGVYAGLFNSMQIQGILFCVIFFIMTICFAFIRPYRVRLLNIYLILCYICLGSSALMGALRASFTAFTVASVFLLPDYTTGILAIINGVWLITTIGFVIYVIRHRQKLWPKLDVDNYIETTSKEDATTRKYVKAVLRARAVIEFAVSMPPMFAPVHELSRQVLLVNALFREAEATNDPLQDTLWDILEELSHLHARLLPRSLFAESVKPSVRRTAAEFLAIMPQLARRLHQREYDFIMTHPVRRRILFKLYALSVFLRGSREAREREFRVSERVDRVWRPTHEQDDVYYPSLYPEIEEGPSVLTVSMPLARELSKNDDRRELELKAVSNSLVDLTEAIEMEGATVDDHAATAANGVSNEAFENDEVVDMEASPVREDSGQVNESSPANEPSVSEPRQVTPENEVPKPSASPTDEPLIDLKDEQKDVPNVSEDRPASSHSSKSPKQPVQVEI